LLGQRARGARAADRERRRPSQPREVAEDVVEPLGIRGRDDDAVRAQLASFLLERRDRCVLAEIRDPPAAVAQSQAERDQPEVVVLVRRAGEQRVGARPLAPAPPEPKQPAPEDVAREMLLRDACVAALPRLTEIVEVRQHDVAQDSIDAERGEQPVEHDVCPALGEAGEGVGQLPPRLRDKLDAVGL
jgi:hypothetical protein